MHRLADVTIQTYGRIDAWINNAGVAVYAPFRDMPLDDARRIIDVNFFGQLHGAGKQLSVGERLTPRLVDLSLRSYVFRAHRTRWPKSAAAPNNLYEPVEEDGGVRGIFLDETHHRSVYQYLQPHALPLIVALAFADAIAYTGSIAFADHTRDGRGRNGHKRGGHTRDRRTAFRRRSNG